MSSVHVARQGFITKSALPSVTRVRGTTAISNAITLLINGNGTNGVQNNTFIDGSTNNFTITRNGNTTQGTFSPFSQAAGEWSNYFDGTGDNLTLADNSAFTLSTNDFTIEAWYYLTNLPAGVGQGLAGHGTGALSNRSWLLWAANGANPLTPDFSIINSSGTEVKCPSSVSTVANAWTHIAVVRDGATIRMYINGVQVGTANFGAGTAVRDSTDLFYIGQLGSTGNAMTGYVSNFRLVNGTCLYPSGTSFTPPTTPLTAITNTSLLTCQDNRFRDASTNNFAITRNGDVRVRPFSPFAPTAAYDAGTNGGSGFFDGTGDYLSIADSATVRFGTGNFTIQGWIFRSVAGAAHTIAAKGGASTGWVFQVTSTNVLRFTHTTTNIDTTTTIPAGQWVHVAVTREGTGTNQLKLFINGTESATGTVSTDFNQTEALNIGADRGNANVMNGYISGFKYNVGTAETITVPTAPPTGGTVLLNFTNAGIIDISGKNVVETVGNAQLNTTFKQFGSASIDFDGSGDGLFLSASPDLQFLTGDFTVEGWLYIKAGATNVIVLFDNRVPDTANIGFTVQLGHSGGLYNVSMGTALSNYIVGATNLARETWHHIAATRSGNTFRLFANGTLVGTFNGSSTQNFTNSVMRIGYGVNSTSGNCYFDDIRIVKGRALYTSAFPPPTAEFSVLNATVDNFVSNATYGVYQLA